MKMRVVGALVLVASALVGCNSERPSAPPASVAPATPASVAVVAPIAPSCPPVAAPAPVETAHAAVTTPAKPAPAEPSPAADGKIFVKRLVLSSAVKGREPVSPTTSFKADAGKIYAFVELENKAKAPSEITVEFAPPGGGTSAGNVKLAVGESPHWRTWAFTRSARAAGSWTAIVKDRHGNELARTPFEVTL